MESPVLKIIDYVPGHQPWFEKFNREWIEKFFWMEPVDFDVLQNPDQHIISKGGFIFMAQLGSELVGTVALKFVSDGIYEFTKMAVTDKYQGLKIGKELSLNAIKKAKELRANKIILYSNTKLISALALYRKFGFVEVALDGPYKRSDIKMELLLN
jgi:GNAT superfamily N-acetyltransferase